MSPRIPTFLLALFLGLACTEFAVAQERGGQPDPGSVGRPDPPRRDSPRRVPPPSTPNPAPAPQRLYIQYKAYCKVKIGHTKYKYNVSVSTDTAGMNSFKVDSIVLKMNSGQGWFTESWINRDRVKYRDFHYGTMSCSNPSIEVTVTHQGRTWTTSNIARRRSPNGGNRSYFMAPSTSLVSEDGLVTFTYDTDEDEDEVDEVDRSRLRSVCGTPSEARLDVEVSEVDIRVNCLPYVSFSRVAPAPPVLIPLAEALSRN